MDSENAYELNAREFLQARDESCIGANVVKRWALGLGSGAAVIELGSGGGYPITQALVAAGLRLWAVDSSPTLVAEFQTRFPDVAVQCARVQESTFFDRTYDGAIAVGLVFLLPESEQAVVISRIARIVLPGGRFLFTAPVEKGNWVDMNTGLECRSLGQTVYENHLKTAGLRLVASYTDAGGNHYYDTERIG